jgi:hypothetical protein
MSQSVVVIPTQFAVDNVTIEQSGGTLQVKDLGISTGKLAANAVTAAKIANATITTTQISGSAAITNSQLATPAHFYLVEDCQDASAGAVTTMDIASLDLDTDGYYEFMAHIKNGSGGNSLYRLYANANTTNTNYRCQANTASSTVFSGAYNNDSYVGVNNVASNGELVIFGKIFRGPNGFPVFQGMYMNLSATGGVNDAGSFHHTFQSAGNMTSFQITASAASGCGQNSKFTLWKLKRS